ncbi:MAG: TMEM175 family protein [Caulobacteraceae bacterium]
MDAYALSFVVVAVYWLAHRRFMAMIVIVDAPVTVLTLVMLALVTLIPAAARLADLPGAAPPVMLVYGDLVIAIGLSLAAT